MSRPDRSPAAYSQRMGAIHAMSCRPEGVTAAELVARMGYASYNSAHGALNAAAGAFGMCRVRRSGTRELHYFASIALAEAWGGSPVAPAAPAAPAEPAVPQVVQRAAWPIVPPVDRCRVDVPPVPGWDRPPARRAGADDWRRCGNVLLGVHRQGYGR